MANRCCTVDSFDRFCTLWACFACPGGGSKSHFAPHKLLESENQQMERFRPARNAIDRQIISRSQVYELAFCNTNKWVSSCKLLNRSPHTDLETLKLSVLAHPIYNTNKWRSGSRFECPISTVSPVRMP